jgi:hypothetical protein
MGKSIGPSGIDKGHRSHNGLLEATIVPAGIDKGHRKPDPLLGVNISPADNIY